MSAQALRGACSCGRNLYIIEIPAQRETSELDVFLDNSSATSECRANAQAISSLPRYLWLCFKTEPELKLWWLYLGRHHAAPLTAFVRVPLTWYQSTTFAYLPDETHSSIRRTYTDPSQPDTQRQFCGYCGTQLSRWTERQREDADFIHLTLGSIVDEDVAILNDMGLLPSLEDDEEQASQEGENRRITRQVIRHRGNRVVSSTSSRHVLGRGSPWFQEMIEDTGLGRVKTQRGGYIAEDGAPKLDYELIEVEEDEISATDASSATVKRKWQGELGGRNAGEEDVNMSGALKDD